jgi:gas vesicle protein
MANSHKGAKDFFLGALIGGVIGVAAVSISQSKKKGSSKRIIGMIEHVGKAISSSEGENNLSEIIEWTAEGIHLWNKLKKGS